MAYQGYSSDDTGKTLTPTAQPVEIALNDMGDKNASLPSIHNDTGGDRFES
jgi:hypothetical protein